jgi:hypothetical protein
MNPDQENEGQEKQSGGGFINTVNNFIGPKFGPKNFLGMGSGATAGTATGGAAAGAGGATAAGGAAAGGAAGAAAGGTAVAATPVGWIIIAVVIAIAIITFLIVYFTGKDQQSTQTITEQSITAPAEL